MPCQKNGPVGSQGGVRLHYAAKNDVKAGKVELVCLHAKEATLSTTPGQATGHPISGGWWRCNGDRTFSNALTTISGARDDDTKEIRVFNYRLVFLTRQVICFIFIHFAIHLTRSTTASSCVVLLLICLRNQN